jgi:single-stranded DNA-binding protein
MTSQLYLAGRLIAAPELSQTKKGHLQVRILVETELVRNGSGGLVSETVVLPVSLFSRQADAVKDLSQGDFLTLGIHLYGTKYEAPDGRVSHGVKIVADDVLAIRSGDDQQRASN